MFIQYAADPSRPWEGIGPLQYAASTGRLCGAIEHALGDESEGPHGLIIPLPDGVTDAGQLRADLVNLRGSVALPETTQGGYSEGGGRPSRDWRPERLGADPPAGLVSLRSDVAAGVLAACGVGVPLATGATDGTAMRESYRRFVASTMQPVARLVQAELRSKLEIPELALTFATLAAADVAGRARAYSALRKVEMPDADARRIVGFE